jgi:hypothetical protein
MATIPNKIDVSPVIHAGHDLYYVSGGTLGSAYQTGDTLVYAYRDINGNNDATIQYLNGSWSDLSSTNNPTSVVANSNNEQNITIVLGNTYNTGFVNPFYGSSSGVTGTVKKVFCNFW